MRVRRVWHFRRPNVFSRARMVRPSCSSASGAFVIMVSSWRSRPGSLPNAPSASTCQWRRLWAAMDAGTLLRALQSRAREFLAEVPKPSSEGELVPEAVLYAFELAHDLIERDHGQMRSALLWFGDKVLSQALLGFCVGLPGGDLRCEFFKGRNYDPADASSVLGFVACADSHARELNTGLVDADLPQWERDLAEMTGVAAGHFAMAGYPRILRTLRGAAGSHRMRDPATLWRCEMCPSLCAPRLRIRQRRFIGADEARPDPLTVMVDGSLASVVGEASSALADLSLNREAAARATVADLVAGSPPHLCFAPGARCGG